ncbi:MAG: DnaJ domain-containing protein [Candidatus Aegiribacteria sp.]|nr:DnaJ domain-containing protein [Candidatus Aegiribacteria sp.]
MDDSAQDFYGILGIKYGATQNEIEDAYHDIARKLHPDVTGDNRELTERYMAVNEAYHVLSRPEDRADYDASIGVEQQAKDKEKEPESRIIRNEVRPGVDMRHLDAKLKRTVRQAEELCRKDNFWEATRILEGFLKTHPDNAELRKTLATAALGRKRYHEAVNHMKVACEVEYSTLDNFVQLGRIYIQAGQLVLAEKALREALGWNAEHEGALSMMREIGELRDAEKPPIKRMLIKVTKAFKRKE